MAQWLAAAPDMSCGTRTCSSDTEFSESQEIPHGPNFSLVMAGPHRLGKIKCTTDFPEARLLFEATENPKEAFIAG